MKNTDMDCPIPLHPDVILHMKNLGATLPSSHGLYFKTEPDDDNKDLLIWTCEAVLNMESALITSELAMAA